MAAFYLVKHQQQRSRVNRGGADKAGGPYHAHRVIQLQLVLKPIDGYILGQICSDKKKRAGEGGQPRQWSIPLTVRARNGNKQTLLQRERVPRDPTTQRAVCACLLCGRKVAKATREHKCAHCCGRIINTHTSRRTHDYQLWRCILRRISSRQTGMQGTISLCGTRCAP